MDSLLGRKKQAPVLFTPLTFLQQYSYKILTLVSLHGWCLLPRIYGSLERTKNSPEYKDQAQHRQGTEVILAL